MSPFDAMKRKIRQECLEKEEAFCTSACPFRLDVREFVARAGRGAFNSAYRTFANTVGFPGVVAALCDKACEEVCPRRETDAPVALNLLERTVLSLARDRRPTSYNMPAKKGRFAVVGAGLSGLGCALRLTNKKYQVAVFERTGRIGGSLWDLPDAPVLLADVEQQFMHERYDLHLNARVDDPRDLLQDFDGVYIATGKGGVDFGLMAPSRDGGFPMATELPGVFIGGEVTGAAPMEALAQGLRGSTVLENWLKTGNMRSAPVSSPTKMLLDPSALVVTPPVLPAGEVYTKEEAAEEAARCIRCRCDACVRHCSFLSYFEKFPKRIDEEVEITITPGTLDGNGTVATRLISTCNQCGLCGEVCPKDIDVGVYLRGAHNAMRSKGAMPWAFHEFWLRDMAFSNGDRAGLAAPPPGGEICEFLFFPGCQLGGSDPRYVVESYRFLLGKNPGVGLLLGCCGAPAVWAGDEPLHEGVREGLTAHWRALGSPRVIVACPSCLQMFGEFLPEIPCVFLADLLDGWGALPKERSDGAFASVFDPCSLRHRPQSGQSVRSLVQRAGYVLSPLPYEGERAQCCSWGAQIDTTNPPFARWLSSVRASDGEAPYITSCSNCRDVFASLGKPVRHYLDVVFGLGGWDRRSPGATERRRNRERLKEDITAEFWPGSRSATEGMVVKKRLVVSTELMEKMDGLRLLEEDALAIIEACEASGRKILDTATGHFFGSGAVGRMTQWVEYTLFEGGYVLHNTYSHRMKIEH